MRGNSKKNAGENRSENGRKTKKKKRPEGGRPWRFGPPDLAQKPRFSGIFRVPSWLAPVIFPNSDFFSMKSVDLRRHRGSTAGIMESSSDTSKLSTDRSRKCTFCPTDREIDWTDVAGLLILIKIWNCMVIRCWLTWRSIDDRRQKDSKGRGAARDSSSDRETI